MVNTAQKGDIGQTVEVDLQFHKMIWQIADQHRLFDILEGLISKIKMYVAANSFLQDYIANGIYDHKGILDAFHNKDPEGGMVSVKNNMKDAADTIIGQLQERG